MDFPISRAAKWVPHILLPLTAQMPYPFFLRGLDVRFHVNAVQKIIM